MIAQKTQQRAAFVQADVLKREGLLERDLFLVRQLMAYRHGEHQAVGAEVDDLQTRCFHRPGDDAHVGAAVEHAAHDVPGQALLQIHRNAGPLRQKSRQHFGQKLGDGGGVGEDADVAG